MTKRIRAGSVVFTQAQGDSLVSRCIMRATRKGVPFLPFTQEPKTKFSHVACVLKDANKPENIQLIEMTHPEMRVKPLTYYLDKGCSVEIYEKIGLLKEIGRAIAAKLESYKGKRYDYTKIALFLADAIISKIITVLYALPLLIISLGKIKCKGVEFALFSRIDLTGALVCSQSVAKEYWKYADTHFGQKGYLGCNPDNMHDHVSKSPLWRKVFDHEDHIFGRWQSFDLVEKI